MSHYLFFSLNIFYALTKTDVNVNLYVKDYSYVIQFSEEKKEKNWSLQTVLEILLYVLHHASVNYTVCDTYRLIW